MREGGQSGCLPYKYKTTMMTLLLLLSLVSLHPMCPILPTPTWSSLLVGLFMALRLWSALVIVVVVVVFVVAGCCSHLMAAGPHLLDSSCCFPFSCGCQAVGWPGLLWWWDLHDMACG